VVADALSCLEIKETPFEDTQESFLGLMECFAKIADIDEFHALNNQQLTNAQDRDKTIRKILKMRKTLDLCKDFHGGGKTTSLGCFKEKIVIPGRLQKHVIHWYHTTLCHPGINRTEETFGQHLWWPKMQAHISNYVQICPLCQRNKRRQKKYGLLPPELAEATPWDKPCVNLIGPYKIRRKGIKDLICRCVTI
jgi:hypothetical protein